jgi:hypothetical protein
MHKARATEYVKNIGEHGVWRIVPTHGERARCDYLVLSVMT